MDAETIFLFLFWGAVIAVNVYGRWREHLRKRDGAGRGDDLGAARTGDEIEAHSRGEARRVEPRESAEDLIPDDLWEILTGQPRAPRPPAPPEPNEYEYTEATQAEWEGGEGDAPRIEQDHGGNASRQTPPPLSAGSDDSNDTWSIPEPQPIDLGRDAGPRDRSPHEAPVRAPREMVARSRVREAVSLEETFVPRERRRSDQPRGVRPAERDRSPKSAPPPGKAAARRRALRRAIIMSEVLGTPKGLEDDF